MGVVRSDDQNRIRTEWNEAHPDSPATTWGAPCGCSVDTTFDKATKDRAVDDWDFLQTIAACRRHPANADGFAAAHHESALVQYAADVARMALGLEKITDLVGWDYDGTAGVARIYARSDAQLAAIQAAVDVNFGPGVVQAVRRVRRGTRIPTRS